MDILYFLLTIFSAYAIIFLDIPIKKLTSTLTKEMSTIMQKFCGLL